LDFVVESQAGRRVEYGSEGEEMRILLQMPFFRNLGSDLQVRRFAGSQVCRLQCLCGRSRLAAAAAGRWKMDTHCIQIEPTERWQRSATATPSVKRVRERGSEERRIRGSGDDKFHSLKRAGEPLDPVVVPSCEL
jgi:hypothetical protein